MGHSRKNKKAPETEPQRQRTKALATGNAARWHGYEARLGFGMTRSRNHRRARHPTIVMPICPSFFFLFVPDFPRFIVRPAFRSTPPTHTITFIPILIVISVTAAETAT